MYLSFMYLYVRESFNCLIMYMIICIYILHKEMWLSEEVKIDREKCSSILGDRRKLFLMILFTFKDAIASIDLTCIALFVIVFEVCISFVKMSESQ